jgi:outer membrane autotransporter protein
MSKGLSNKARVASLSTLRKTAMMGAAATAFMGAARSLYAGVSVEPVTTVQAAVKDALNGPKKLPTKRLEQAAPQAPIRISAIDIGNGDDISVGPDETALSQADAVEDINVVNTGNLTGGIGIEVSTGAVNFADAIFDETTSYVVPGMYEMLYDNAGNPVYGPYGPLSAATAEFSYTTRSVVLARDPLESGISIDNAGSIDFSGSRGIKASNPSGESITITNSGDITATQEVAGRVGIDASTESFSDTFDDELIQEGEFTRNANGQLVEVIAPNQFETYRQRVDMGYDGGTINIHNTGDIDMGAVSGPWPYGTQSVGIYARGDGGTTIVNDGHITVDRWSSAIQVATTGALTITNNGRIDVGNGSHGMTTNQSNGNAGDYRLGGDVYVLNTGDIFGGTTKEEAGPDDNTVFVTGMNIFALGSNNEYMANIAEVNQTYAAYNQLLGYEAFPLIDAPNLRLYTTTVVNQGHIELKDGGVGVQILPRAGDSYAINSGTIIVGDGVSIAEGNNQNPSAGLSQTNFPFDGTGKTVSINTETGIIVTGDDSAGIQNHNLAGISITINDGSITTGNGVSTRITDYTGTTFDRLFQTFGMVSVAPAPMFGTYAYGLNTGEITVGELAIGSATSGQGFSLIDQSRPTSININEGIISTGDNSTGMIAWGTVATAANTGTITTGNYDISAFLPHPEFTADEFAQLKFGMASYGSNMAEAVNGGSITTGDDTIGVAARSNFPGYGFGSRVLQNDEGVITSGDRSIGVQVLGNYYAGFVNEGEISVGDDSVGADITAGSVNLRYGDLTATIVEGTLLATNAGIIETGDNSIGLRMDGVQLDVAYSGRVLVPDPDQDPYPYMYVYVEGSADTIGATYLVNTGTVEVGANSTGVIITGTAANEEGLHFFNTGTVDASQGGSTALGLNADNNLDSFAVNVGTMAGDITFGAGDDRFINTLMIDNAGRVTHSGNIVMNGSTIDFGGGTNSFENDRGMITLAGGENLITGADLNMIQASIEARNNAIDSSLTIDGNVSGDFAFGADFGSSGSDQLIITGDLADGSSMSLVLNATEQLSGDTSVTVVTVGGENHGDAPVIEGITGNFADSLQSAEVVYEDGEVIVTAHFGMGHMATSAASATTMAQHWWMQSAGSLDKRDMQRLAGLEDAGLSAWATVFHEEGSVDPTNDLQDVSFDQKVSGMQTGIEWKGDVGGGSFNIGPMFSYGNASSAQNANLASARGDATAYGLNAGYRFGNGLYLNALWQQMSMEIDFKTPGTFSGATGSTDAEGDGFDVELGYAYKLGSGLTLAPQLQYASVDVEVDDFTSSDDVYALSGMSGKHSLLRAGLSVFKTFETTNGSITPLVDLSYLDAMDGTSELSSNGIAFGNDTSGSGYRAEFGVAGRYKGWDIAGRVGIADTTAIKSALSSNLTVRFRW